MNEREEHKELIQRMAEALRSHTEPYREGAWERFSARHGKPKRRIVGWPYWSAAAVLLLAFGWYMLDGRFDATDAVGQGNGSQQVAQESVVQQESAVPLADEPVAPIARSPRNRDRAFSTAQRPSLSAGRLAVAPAIAPRDTTDSQGVPANTLVAVGIPVEKTAGDSAQRLAIAVVPDVSGQDAGQAHGADAFAREALGNDYAVAANNVDNRTKKWDLGLVVSPTVTSEQVNMGGGIAVAYRLSDRFSVSSGLSIGALGLAQNSNGPKARAFGFDGKHASPVEGSTGFLSNADSYKEVTEVTSTILALDIPFDLRYNFTERFYTSVGVSFVNVLNEQRTAHFVDRLNEATFGQKNATGNNLETSVQAVYSTEKTGYHPLQGNGYAGFLNFSMGRSVPFSRKFSLSFEPYFKLPIGKLSREEMDFTHGGIRIVTGF